MKNENNSRKDNHKKTKKNNANQPAWLWPVKILLLAFFISLFFGATSELVLNKTGIIIAVIIIIMFILISVVADMIGVAVTSCNAQPFRAMASKKVKGAKESLKLLKKADRVASICCDVIGDVCGTLSGAAGASILGKIVFSSSSSALEIIIATLVSATIASATIFGKALGKKYSINNCNAIILKVGKVISLFSPKNSKSKKQETVELEIDDDGKQKDDLEQNITDINND